MQMWFSETPPVVITLFNRFFLPPNGTLVLIRSKLSMKFQCIDQVVLEKAKNNCNR